MRRKLILNCVTIVQKRKKQERYREKQLGEEKVIVNKNATKERSVKRKTKNRENSC